MRRRLIVTMLGGAALLLAGCGEPVQVGAGGPPAQPITRAANTGSTGSTSGSPSPEQPPSSDERKCTSADVQGVFADESMKNTDIAQLFVVVTNTSDHVCALYGFGGLELHTGGDGSTLQLNLTRVQPPAPTTVVLKPGDKAYKKLHWKLPPSEADAGNCARGASYAYVTLPDDTKTIEVHPQGRSDELPDVCGGVIKGYAWTATEQPG